METILRFLTARNLAMAGSVALGVVILDAYQEYPRRVLDRLFSGPRAEAVAPALDMDQDLNRRESLKLKRLHATITAEISAAAAKGLRVDGLQRAADSALQLDTPRYRAAAIERLNKLRLAVPQGAAGIRPAIPSDDPSDGPKTPRSRTVPRKRSS